jgi:hypothetical protein
MGIKTTQNFTLIRKLLRKMQTICYQKSYRQKNCGPWPNPPPPLYASMVAMWQLGGKGGRDKPPAD